MAAYKIEIERVANGYEVEIYDHKIMKQNEKSGSGEYGPKYKDPRVTYVFKTEAEVMDFLTKNMSKALPKSEFDAAYDAAAKEENDD
jgi:hypothetical protein